MPTGIDARPVTRLLPETAKKPAEFFVNPNSLFCELPVASLKVRTPIVDPTAAFVEMDELLMLIAIKFSVLAGLYIADFCKMSMKKYAMSHGKETWGGRSRRCGCTCDSRGTAWRRHYHGYAFRSCAAPSRSSARLPRRHRRRLGRPRRRNATRTGSRGGEHGGVRDRRHRGGARGRAVLQQ